MIGAIIGDIVGSRFEFVEFKEKEFNFFDADCEITDDSIMTLAVAKTLAECDGDYSDLGARCVKVMKEVAKDYPHAGWGTMFYKWLYEGEARPYNSYGNGAAMRISPVGFVASDIDEAKLLSRAVTEISHNHPEGIKGAEATAVAIVLARQGRTKEQIKAYISQNYYNLDFTLDEIRPKYYFNETCQATVPQALEAFFESTDFEDAIRNAVSLGGDSDTLAAITGGVAEAYYGVPKAMEDWALEYMDDYLYGVYAQGRAFLLSKQKPKPEV